MIHVHLRYFASFAEATGRDAETLMIDHQDGAALFATLSARFQFRMPMARVRLAVNDHFVDWTHRLQDGDHVVFIPPVSGG
ncbi:molybdopterin synthase sulfur carrier subunit [Ahniella affigens]|uniref:Molybdopterin synthase sulfur carrier subunit n=1 Tax=Ahniella affigens TaxID=2021234 RepID=A0A2P1PTU5_9GAMM|nr:MoaD/ThiS family protein [Ahniella affigens]AVP98250.1 molybdopterin synthase sulfur carrier subunit [Ahniella affigens]